MFKIAIIARHWVGHNSPMIALENGIYVSMYSYVATGSHYYDGLKFACIDFSSQQQKKKEGALHTDRPVFEFPNCSAEFPN